MRGIIFKSAVSNLYYQLIQYYLGFLEKNDIKEKKTIDNSVKNIAKSEQTHFFPRGLKPNTIRNNSNPKKQNKNISQKNIKILLKILHQEKDLASLNE